jgi:hypothetical protein
MQTLWEGKFKEESITTGAKLHVFTDASQSAYGSCAYIVTGDSINTCNGKEQSGYIKTNHTA